MNCVSVIVTLSLLISCSSKREIVQTEQRHFFGDFLQGINIEDTILTIPINIDNNLIKSDNLLQLSSPTKGALTIRHAEVNNHTTTYIEKKDTIKQVKTKGKKIDNVSLFQVSSLIFCALFLTIIFVYVVRRHYGKTS